MSPRPVPAKFRVSDDQGDEATFAWVSECLASPAANSSRIRFESIVGLLSMARG